MSGSSLRLARAIPVPFPELSDAANWNLEPYYRTIRYADIDGDGRAELLARGSAGISVWRLEPSGSWTQWPDGPPLADSAGWAGRHYAETIQLADIDGDGRAELLARAGNGIIAFQCDRTTHAWYGLPDGPPLNDASNWHQPWYYRTIQYADIDGDGRAELVARGSVGIHTYKYEPASRTWSALAVGSPPLSDASGWGGSQYYSTIRCADIDGDGRAELMARSSAGISTWKFDQASHTWVGYARNTPNFDDAAGWVNPQYYSTIQYADIDGDGRAELLGRGGDGITLWKFSQETRLWSEIEHGSPPLSDASGWALAPYYSTIQYADIDGDRQAELVARGAAGVHTYKYDPARRTWDALAVGAPAFSDASGWSAPHYAGTIRCADIDGDGRAELLGRWSGGMIAFQFDGAAHTWASLADRRVQIERSNSTLLLGRPLVEGEAVIYREDWAGTPAARLVTADIADLDRLLPSPTGLRVGRGTGVTIFQGAGFTGSSLQLPAGVPRLQDTRTGVPKSLRIWPDLDRPFTGAWALRAPNGGYLRLGAAQQPVSVNVTTGGRVTNDALFRIVDLGAAGEGRRRVRIEALGGGAAFLDTAYAFSRLAQGLRIEPGAELLTLVDEPAAGIRAFSLIDSGGRWIAQQADGSFARTGDAAQRAILTRAIKVAGDETQVGTLLSGEIAFYEHVNYAGKAWIFYADLANFLDVDGLNDQASSLRLGPRTGATLYSDVGYSGVRQDVVEAVPSLFNQQVGNDTLSSFHVWHDIAPADAGISFTSSLSQEYRRAGGAWQTFSAYRTVLQLPPEVRQVELWATDTTDITVGERTYQIDEDRPVLLTPNSMHRIMITSPAAGVSTPGLKLRTDRMQPIERCVIFPDRALHERLATLKDDALYEAQAGGQPLVDQANVTREQAAAVQATIARTMATVRYSEDTTLAERRVAAGAVQAAPWKLDFGAPLPPKPDGGTAIVSPDDGSGQPEPDPSRLVFKGPTLQQLNPAEVDQLLAAASQQGGTLAQGFFDDLWRDIKRAATIVVGAVKDTLVVIGRWVEQTGEKIVRWIVDTAEKVATFVQAVVEKIGVAVTQFVSWLESVFDWGDILTTQRYLEDSVRQGIGFLRQRVAGSAGPVAAFFDSQRDVVRRGLDNIIGGLAGGSRLAAQAANVPHELDWILSRFGDGAAQASTGADLSASQATHQSPWQQVRTSYAEVADTLLRHAPDLVTIAATLPEDPQQAVAAILTIIRDLLDAAIDATRDTLLLLIQLVDTLVGAFEKLISAPLDIPFLSDFYRQVITRGEELTILSLASLIVAVPVTVIGKLRSGQRPFAQGVQLALGTSGDMARDWGIVDSVCGYVTGVMAAVLDPIPETNLPSFAWVFEAQSLVISFFSWLASFPGGYPHLLSFQTESEDDIWDYVGWGYGTFLYALDILSLAASGALERFKRANDVTAAATTVLSAVELVLSISASARTNPSVAAGFADALGTLPGIAAFTRTTPVVSASSGISLAALAGVDNLCATAALVLSNVEA